MCKMSFYVRISCAQEYLQQCKELQCHYDIIPSVAMCDNTVKSG